MQVCACGFGSNSKQQAMLSTQLVAVQCKQLCYLCDMPSFSGDRGLLTCGHPNYGQGLPHRFHAHQAIADLVPDLGSAVYVHSSILVSHGIVGSYQMTL